MGKKSKILYFSVLFVNIVFFFLDLLPINFPFFRISFAVSLMLIGAMLFVRSVSLKIDSSMFFGIVLFLCGVLNLLLYFGQIYWNANTNQFWPYYLFALSIASGITALSFKDKLQLRLFILFFGFATITLLFVYNILPVVAFIVLMIAYFVLYFIINLVIFKKRSK